jgi:hypothetical protein
MANSHVNVLALYEARDTSDESLATLLAEDLSDAANAIEVGRPIEWFEVEPQWGRTANIAAFGVGGVSWLLGTVIDWPWWATRAPLVVALGIVWLAEYMWARRNMIRPGAS